jgi:hypothetical protein
MAILGDSVIILLYSILKERVRQINLVKKGPSGEKSEDAGNINLQPIFLEETGIKRIEISIKICDIGEGRGDRYTPPQGEGGSYAESLRDWGCFKFHCSREHTEFFKH